MSLLRHKLDLLKRASSPAGRVSPPIRPTVDRSVHDSQLLQALGGEFCQTQAGPIHVTTHRYPQDHAYGTVNLCHALNLRPALLNRLYSGLEGLEIESALFFDTETTGLAGGSGTYAFLVGIGYYQAGEFVTEQFLMRDHGDEAALLELLAQRLEGRSGLVSFNGKTFDAQLLSTRYAMHRRSDPMASRAHFDLLHVCRRLWRHSRLPDCRLETLEHRVLGAPRHDDVPGWMIPDLFFGFLRDRNPSPLIGVVEHNRRDLLAMVGLCGVLCDLLEQGRSLPPTGDVHTTLGLARLWAALGEFECSDELYRRCLKAGGLSEEARETALRGWARELKKRDQVEKAALLWRKLLAHYPGHLEATVELAKWFEHQRKDYRTALLLVEGGLRDRTLTGTRRRELEHRALRLKTRVQSAQPVNGG